MNGGLRCGRLRGTIAINVSFAYAVPSENRVCFEPKQRLAPNNDSPLSSNVALWGEDSFAFRRTNSAVIICRATADGYGLPAKARDAANRPALALRMLCRLSNLLLKPRIAIASLFALELRGKRFQ